MQVIYERCAGIDVHKRTVVVCVLVTAPDGSVQREVQTFGTMTADLLALSDWLAARGVRHVAMESTGSSGSRCITCWRRGGRSCWSTRST